jgi:serine acetyltransferase
MRTDGTIYPTAKISERTMLDMRSGTVIGDFTFISCKSLMMYENSCVNRHCELQGRGKITLGSHAQVASHATILTSVDTPWGSMSDSADADIRRIKTADVYIGEQAFIGMYATIMPGVEIGEGAVVGAYSYISTDVRPWTILHPRTSMVEKRRMVDKGLRGYFEKMYSYKHPKMDETSREPKTFTREEYDEMNRLDDE